MKPSPRVAFISAGELFGGIERHLLGLCTWFLRQGQAPLLILFHDAELASQVRLLGVEPIILPTISGVDPTVPRKLARILAQNNIQILHAHGYRAVVNGALARRQRDFRLVRTVHGRPEPGPRWAMTTIKTSLYVSLERYLGRRCHAVNTYVTDDLRQSHARFDTDLDTLTIANGIDPLYAADYKRPPEFEPGVRHLGAIGRVSEVKGLAYAVEAMARLAPDLPAVLYIIGSGPLEAPLRELIIRRGLQGRVRMLGFRKNIYDYLAHLDILVMPSLHEGLPYTILEAMSMGIPIVASQTGGIPEVLSDGETALLTPVGDTIALGRALNTLLTDPELASALAAKACARQIREFSLDSMGQKFMSLYRQLVAEMELEK